VHEIHDKRARNEHNLNNIEKAHEKISVEDKVSPYYQVGMEFSAFFISNSSLAIFFFLFFSSFFSKS